MITYRSLCSGYGGMDLAVESVFDATPVDHAEIDRDAALVHETHWPGVPNLGDVTIVDWLALEPTDVLCAGYPCQPFSEAGLRKGTDDERHLWPDIAEAVRVLRPGLVLLENVSGHRSLGFGTVLGDLASLGYVGFWCSVRASDVGACHRRERVWIAATSGAPGRPRQPGDDLHATVDGRAAAAAHPDSIGRERHRPARPGRPRPAHGDRAVSDPDRELGGRGSPAADPDGAGLQGSDPLRERRGERAARPGGLEIPWGEYGPAIRRHERAFGRRAPLPVDEAGRLSPRFVEWMMGLPDGWVTGVPISRTAQLRILGNGQVPLQATAALRRLLSLLPELTGALT